jgi:hypothetical protein
MPRYTMARTWRDTPNDFIFRVDGQDAGCCYHHYLSISRGHCWHRTVYGSGFAGDEPTLEAAQAKFKAAFFRMARSDAQDGGREPGLADRQLTATSLHRMPAMRNLAMFKSRKACCIWSSRLGDRQHEFQHGEVFPSGL